MDKLERKPWFVMLVSILTTMTTLYLTEGAGLPKLTGMNPYQAILYFLCFGACWKLYSFGGWLLALCFHTPAAKR